MIPPNTPAGTLVIIARRPSDVNTPPMWLPEMDETLGKTGEIFYKYSTGRARIKVETGVDWVYADDWLELFEGDNMHGPNNIHYGQGLPI